MSDNIKYGMEVSLKGDDKVKRGFNSLEDAVDEAADSLDDVAQSSTKAGNHLNKAGQSAEKSGVAAKKSQSWWKSLKNELFSIRGIIASIGFGVFINEVIEVGNVTQGWQASMLAVTSSQQAANEELAHSRKVAKQLGLDIRSTTNSYVQFSAATKGTGLEGRNTTKVFDAVSAAMRVLNRSADDTTGALKALEQMVSKGNVQAEELRGQLGERLPGAFNLAAQAMGVTTVELNKMLEQGQVLAVDLLPKLADALNDKYGAGLAAAVNSPAQAFRNLKNSIFEAYESASSVLFDDLATGAQLLADILDYLGDNAPAILGALGTVLEALIVIVGVRLLTSFVNVTRQGIQQFIASTITASVTTNALGQVVTRTTAKMNLMAIAGRAAKSALALIGGPAGVAALAATALFSFANATFAADTNVGELSRSIDTALGKFEEIEKKALKQDIEERMSLIKELQAEINEVYSSANKNSPLSFIEQGRIDDAIKQTTVLGQEITELQAKLEGLSKSTGENNEDTEKQSHTMSVLSSEAQSLVDRLDPLAALNRQLTTEVTLLTESFTDNEQRQRMLKLLLAEHANAVSKLTEKQKAAISPNQQLINSLKQEAKLLKLSAREKEIHIALSRLSTDATLQEKEAVAALANELFDKKQMQDDDKYYDDLINAAGEFSLSWSSASNVVVDAFGTIGQQLDKLGKQHVAFAKQEEKLEKDRELYANNPEKLRKIAAAEEALAENRTSAHLASYASITSSAAQMFSEESKGRKALQAASQVFTALEVANSLVRGGAYAMEAVAAAFAAPWPIGFASGAAMIAIMAGIGFAVSGGSSGAPVSAEQRQQTQGTGTVLGSDEKSQSILNSYERIEDLELKQYAVLQQMNSSLKSLVNNIANLTVNLIGTYGKFDESSYSGDLSGSNFLDSSMGSFLRKIDPIALTLDLLGLGDFADKIFSGFSKTKKSLIDSGINIVGQTLGEIIESGLVNAQAYYDIKTKKTKFWGLSSKTKYSTEYEELDNSLQREFALIFEDLGTSINEAVDILGLEVAKESNNVNYMLDRFFDGDFKNSRFAEFPEDFFDQFTVELGEAATRSLANFKINIPNLSLKDLSGEEIEKELLAVVSKQADLMVEYLVPQIKEFQQVGEGLYDTLIRLAQEQAVFNSAMKAMGHSIEGNADLTNEAQTRIAQSLISLMGGIDKFKEYTSSYFSEFYTDEEQFDYLKSTLGELFDGLEVALPENRQAFKDLVGSIDITTTEGQALYAQLMSMNQSLDQYYDNLEKVAEGEEKLNAAREAFDLSVAEQLMKLDTSPLKQQLYELQKDFHASFKEAEALGLSTQMLEELYGRKREAIIENALSDINNTHENKLAQLNTQHASATDELVATNERLRSSFTSLKASIANNILSIRRQSSTWSESGYQTGQIESFTGQLGQGTTEEQIANLNSLQQAYVDKYNAELSNIDKARDAAQSAYDAQLSQIEQKYQAELAAYEQIKDAIESIAQAAQDLLLSEFSTLTNQERLAQSQSAFESTLARARGGDLDAISNLSSAGNDYLKEARSFYASSDDYTQIFDSVYSALQDIGNQSVRAPSKTAPPVPAAITQHNERVRALQTSTVEKLNELKELTAELEAQTETEFQSAMNLLHEQLTADTHLLNQSLTSQLSALNEVKAAVQAIDVRPQVNVTNVVPFVRKEPIYQRTQPVKPVIDERSLLADRAVVDKLSAIEQQMKTNNDKLEKRTQQAEQQAKRADNNVRELKKSVVKNNRTNQEQFDAIARFVK